MIASVCDNYTLSQPGGNYDTDCEQGLETHPIFFLLTLNSLPLNEPGALCPMTTSTDTVSLEPGLIYCL